jgi:hypothetical protein
MYAYSFSERISPHRIRTPEGYLIAHGVPIARTGYQTYKARELQPSGVPEIDKLPPESEVPVYRDGKDVFNPASMATFEGKSITRNHPSVGLLNPDNDRQYAVGHVQKVRGPELLPDGESALIADLVFKDAQTITYLENGLADELSCGYRYKLAPLENGDYGWRMTQIVGNHVALVPNGRAGEDIKVLDAAPKPEEGSSQLMEFKEVSEFFKSMGLRLRVAADAESESVETQKKKDEEALRLKERTMDEEMKKEKEAADKRLKDAEAKIEEVSKKQAETKEAVDAGFKRLDDALAKLTAKDAKSCTCDDDEKKDWESEKGHMATAVGEHHAADCPMFKKGAKDADLIPTAALTGEEIPKNPIPGADARVMVSNLRKLKPIIADAYAAGTLDDEVVDTFNNLFRAAKGGKKANDADYAKVLAAANAIDPKAAAAANGGRLIATDNEALKPGSYQEMMKQFSRKNPTEWVMPSQKVQ